MRRRALQGVIDRLRAVRRGSRSRIFVRAARTQRPMLTEMDLDSDRYPGTQSAAHQSPEPLQVDEPARSDDRRGHINSTLRAGVVVRPRYRLRSNRSSVRCFALKLASVRAARFIGGFACVTRRVGITIAGQLRTGGNSRFSTAAGFANHLFPPTSAFGFRILGVNPSVSRTRESRCCIEDDGGPSESPYWRGLQTAGCG
jgi:hypothetical protein